MSNNIRSAAVCVVEREDGCILLLQRSKEPNEFCLPGGKIEDGESNLEGCARELMEEAGIDFNMQEHGYLGWAKSAVKDRTVHVYHMCVDRDCSVMLSDEHTGYAWTKKPLAGFKLAGNTDKMIKLWQETKQ